jgi:hypothetical protein
MASPALQKPAPTRLKKPRFKIIVNRAFQFRALMPLAIFAALLLVLTLALVFIPMNRQIDADPDPLIQALLGAQLLRIEMWLAPLLVLSASLAGIWALIISQRVAGPMRRLHASLAQLAVGKPVVLKFRRKDEFREMEAVFNGVVNRVEALTKGKLELLRFLGRNLEGLAQRAENDDLKAAEVRESLSIILRDLDAEVKKLQTKS